MEPGTEPHNWMWMATREVLLTGWHEDDYEKTDLGGNKKAIDKDSAYAYAIGKYAEVFGPTLDLTKYA